MKNKAETVMDKSVASVHAMENHQLHLRQNGNAEDLIKTNPFYSYHLELSRKACEMENVERRDSVEANLDAIFIPAPEFDSSFLHDEPELNSVENRITFSELDSIQANKYEEDLFLKSILSQKNAPSDDSCDNKSNPFNTNSNIWKANGVETLQNDLFHTRKDDGLFKTESSTETNLFDKSSNRTVDPFKSSLENEFDLFSPSQTNPTNPFYRVANSEPDLFQTNPTKGANVFPGKKSSRDPFTNNEERGAASSKNLDIFASSFTKGVDPFESPLKTDLFQLHGSLSDDPFASPSSSSQVIFPDATRDVFQPLPSEIRTSVDLFAQTPSETSSTPSIFSPSEITSDPSATPNTFQKKAKLPPAVPPKPTQKPHDIILTTPQGSKREILQPTPFSQAGGLSASHSRSPADMDHVQVFSRPPRPLPRMRPPRPPKQPQPVVQTELEPAVSKPSPKTSPKLSFKSLPKPAIRRKPKAPEPKPVDPGNFVVFEDILLLGQEQCIDDWPEDSPENNPDFKPAGKLRLRRESLLIKADSDGGSGDDHDGKSKKKKFGKSLLSRRNSKEKRPEDPVEGKTDKLPVSRKSSKESFTDVPTSKGQSDEEQYGMDYKKPKSSKLLQRATVSSSMADHAQNNHLLQESKKGSSVKKNSIKSNTIGRRWSEGNKLDDGATEEENKGNQETAKKLKIKFVPHRGFAITLEKPKNERKEVNHTGSKDTSDEVLGAYGYTPPEKFDAFEDVEELKSQLSARKASAFQGDDGSQKPHRASLTYDDEEFYEDCKKPAKIKLLHAGRRSSKENKLENGAIQKKKSSFSAQEVEDSELNGVEDCKRKSSKHRGAQLSHKQKTSNGACRSDSFSQYGPQQAKGDESEDEMTGSQCQNLAYVDDEGEFARSKPNKPSKLKGFKKLKQKMKTMHLEADDPKAAACDKNLSEAAKAEWLASQMDERAIADMEDEDEDGDTDSLMEWWYTVEKWDEVPSDEEEAFVKKDPSKSFSVLADKVHHGLRLFNKVFTERAEVLWQSVILLHSIADDISEYHQKSKIAGITGGTTTAVGSVAVITGLALIPVTFGASLIISAVGLGVATAGGITSASAAISDNVHSNNDRKKAENLLNEYEENLLELSKILHFVDKGLSKLRGHAFLRSGTQHYSEDWEVRRSVQMISLVDAPVAQAVQLTDTSVTSLQGLFKGIEKFFTKDTRELKKGSQKEIAAEIRAVAKVLNDNLVKLNAIREDLQESTGNI